MEVSRNRSSRTFEDLLDDVGTHGKRNYLIFFCACIGGWLTGMHSFAYQFLGATPDHWCHVEDLSFTNWTTAQIKFIAIPATIQDGKKLHYTCEMFALNYSALAEMTWEDATVVAGQMLLENNDTTHCYRRSYDTDVETVVTKWDLVCERRALYSTTQAAVQGGMLIGFVLFGWIIDSFGRSYTYNRCLVLYIIFEASTLLSPNVEVFIVMRVVTALMGSGFYLAGFVISVELCSAKQRSSVANYYVIPWSVGMMMVAGFSYVFRPWWQLQVALLVPAFLLLPNIWLLPESPRWLILNGYYDKAFQILNSIAQSNGRALRDKAVVIDEMKQIQLLMKSEEEIRQDGIEKSIKQKAIASIRRIFSLLLDKALRGRTICLFICFFSTAFIYYGVSLGAPSITTDNSLYLFIAGALELPSYLILWPSVSLFGRKKSLVVFFVCTAATILSAMVLQLLDTSNGLSVVRLVLFLIGKFAITAAFHLLWVYTAELYPTKYRSLAVGEANSVSRIGSICSPYVNDLLGTVVPWSPAALFGGFSMLAGVIIISLPETTNQVLPDNLQHVKEEKKCDNNSSQHNNPSFAIS